MRFGTPTSFMRRSLFVGDFLAAKAKSCILRFPFASAIRRFLILVIVFKNKIFRTSTT